jgi:type IV pilus assembly protein PilM
VRKVLPIGVDFGTCSVKLVQLTLSGHSYGVLACARAEAPDLVGLTAEAREEALIEVVKRELAGHRFRGNDCISALADSEVHIRNIRVPQVRGGDLDEAVRSEARSKFPFDTDEAILNYLVAGEVCHGEDVRLEVILFAARQDAVEAHVDRLHRMGLMPASLDVQQCAMFRTFERYLRRKEDESEVNVFVDLGGRTKVVITRGRDVLFIKNIERGGLTFTDAVASRLNLSHEEARALRRRLARDGEGNGAGGEPCDRNVRQALLDAMRPEIEELAAEINKCLRYHSVTFRGARPEHLTFIGGETYEGGIPEMLGKRLGTPVVIGQPFRGIDINTLGPDMDRRGMLSEWTVAFGLSLKGAFINGLGLGQRMAG